MQKVSQKAATLIGSEIIKLGGEINKKIREGNKIYNLTIGDFDPSLFPIPDVFRDEIIKAYQKGETNYPPADGVLELKKAVQKFISDYQGLHFSDDEVMIAGGGRPLIHAIYQTIVDPEDKVFYPVPSWNNNHYCHLSDAQKIEVHTHPENGFMPSAADLAPYISEVVMVALCSPLNPTGTTFRKEQLMEICEMVLAENKKRAGIKKPVYILFDQIYWMLRTDGIDHYDPVSLLPEMKEYTIFVDGISKSLASTGVRVGWGLGPADVISKMKSILGHIGAWAPRAEQVAAAAFLSNSEALFAYLNELKTKLDKRLIPLAEGIQELGRKGYPVHAINPEGAIYLSVQFSLIGKIKPDGSIIQTTQDITDYLLNKAQLAIVPFTAFGCESGTDWYRVSVGTLNDLQIGELFDKLEIALKELN